MALAAFAVLFTGCAGMQEQRLAVDKLKLQTAELKFSLDETRARLDDLGNRFVLLQEKLDASRAEIDRLHASAVPAAPPQGLAVVPLTEEAQKETPKYNPGPSQKAHTVQKESDDVQPEAMYNKGQDLFIAGRYEEARGAFNAFLKAFPSHSLSDNALYWIGESYYAEKDFPKALEKFNELADKYPGENKAPDALLKAGLSYMEMNQGDKARGVLEKLIARHPGTDAASRARKAVADAGAKEGTR